MRGVFIGLAIIAAVFAAGLIFEYLRWTQKSATATAGD